MQLLSKSICPETKKEKVKKIVKKYFVAVVVVFLFIPNNSENKFFFNIIPRLNDTIKSQIK